MTSCPERRPRSCWWQIDEAMRPLGLERELPLLRRGGSGALRFWLLERIDQRPEVGRLRCEYAGDGL